MIINPAARIERSIIRHFPKIKAVIEDDSLQDAECFMKIEEIVRVFEQLGSSGKSRHDFG
ncbi:hypothetical protein [Candidatus Soleaferrea massiliensis]|uniref:hypothetical protein n=1 Tax=Candidatus Soleaferrea massiliensis TaxID=1470354 RepID=UPI00058DC221|nr:hypothetical protein [Candidatus Soleaferrea massiliensis]